MAMKSNSRILLLFSLLLIFSLSILAQKPYNYQRKMEKYRSIKIAYFTDNLELTPNEAEIFWPLYNKYDQQKEEIRRERRKKSKEFSQQGDLFTEQEAEEIIDNHIEMRQKEMELDMEFHKELKAVLPAKKIMKFYITEVQFREYMLRRIREDHGNEVPGRGRNSPYCP